MYVLYNVYIYKMCILYTYIKWEVKFQDSESENIFQVYNIIFISRVRRLFYFFHRRIWLEMYCSYWLRNVKHESLLLTRFIRGSRVITSSNVIDTSFFAFMWLLFFFRFPSSFRSCFLINESYVVNLYQRLCKWKLRIAFAIIHFLRN